jgi:uncharacterized membrane protein YqgA involved in biofilm formation
VTGTFVNVGAILLGTLVGTLIGSRLPTGLQERVMSGLGLVTAVLGIDLALAWRDTNVLYVMGAILLGAVVGELLQIERRLDAFGDRLQRRFAGGDGSTISEAFVTASLLYCIGPWRWSAPSGRPDRRLERPGHQVAARRLRLRGLAAALGWGVALSAVAVLVIQGGFSLGAGLFDDVLRGEVLAALVATGGLLLVGIGLKLLAIRDLKVGNFLPALLFAPVIAGVVESIS